MIRYHITMKLFEPKRAFFEEASLEYPLGKKILKHLDAAGIPVRVIGSHNRVTGIPGVNAMQSYREGKRTLVVGVKRDLHLSTCKPSADFEFALATSCPGGCQYCYLQTHLGKKPYIRVYVNIDEILSRVKTLSDKDPEKIITFEAASTSDPLAVEHITGSLARTIDFIGELSNARLRVVTKFSNVTPLLDLEHHGHTRFRFSINTPTVVKRFEQNTAPLEERIAAARRMSQAGYPVGFIIAPLLIYPDYQQDYASLLDQVAAALQPIPPDLTFELISHRFTRSAKKVIEERFPGTLLDLDESRRRPKYGKYGLVKFIYPEVEYHQLQQHLYSLIAHFFPTARVQSFT